MTLTRHLREAGQLNSVNTPMALWRRPRSYSSWGSLHSSSSSVKLLSHRNECHSDALFMSSTPKLRYGASSDWTPSNLSQSNCFPKHLRNMRSAKLRHEFWTVQVNYMLLSERMNFNSSTEEYTVAVCVKPWGVADLSWAWKDCHGKS